MERGTKEERYGRPSSEIQERKKISCPPPLLHFKMSWKEEKLNLQKSFIVDAAMRRGEEGWMTHSPTIERKEGEGENVPDTHARRGATGKLSRRMQQLREEKEKEEP